MVDFYKWINQILTTGSVFRTLLGTEFHQNAVLFPIKNEKLNPLSVFGLSTLTLTHTQNS